MIGDRSTWNLLDGIFKRLITHGRLTVRWPNGQERIYAGNSGPGPTACMELRTSRAVRRMALDPALAMGELYMDRELMPLGCSIFDVLDVLVLNLAHNAAGHPLARFGSAIGRWKRRLDQYNPAARSQRNAAHHYDLNGQLYSLFLDHDRQYSCAYFPTGTETLDQAQIAKKHHIAAKLLLRDSGMEVLDIGCGWGGLALTLARDYGARVLGVTLSQEQLSEAQARAKAAGLDDRVRFELRDYRELTGSFDRIVSVGMFEHVGVNHYPQFFAMARRRLKPNGVMLLHTIGRSGPPGATNPWLRKYIFPGGYTPALSELMAGLEPSGLCVTDIEVLRLHYAQTLHHWRRRFDANRDTIAAIYDDRFSRMFEFYLAGAELAFRHDGCVVFQLQLALDQGNVPLTREYITNAERAVNRSPINVCMTSS
jgi:cyclopropane-fatty-acyl-phospholipid synthase